MILSTLVFARSLLEERTTSLFGNSQVNCCLSLQISIAIKTQVRPRNVESVANAFRESRPNDFILKLSRILNQFHRHKVTPSVQAIDDHHESNLLEEFLGRGDYSGRFPEPSRIQS